MQIGRDTEAKRETVEKQDKTDGRGGGHGGGGAVVEGGGATLSRLLHCMLR